MSEPVPTDPNEDSFAELLRREIRDLREQRGPCPTSETLVAFHEGRLASEEAAPVRDHVEACGVCDVLLGRLEAAERKRPRSALAAIWAFMRRPVVAYGLVALLLIPAYRGLVPPVGDLAMKPGVGVVPVPSFSLDNVRSDSQTQKLPSVRLAGNEKFLLLSFFIPLKASPPHRYEVVVVRENQTAVVPAQALRNCDEVGNCFLLCDAALFAPGRYEVRVQEMPPGDGIVVHPFPFQITR